MRYGKSILFVLSLTTLCCSPPDSKSNSTKFRQYYIKGEQLYVQHCSNCHQKDGSGLGLLYPPLQDSDFMESRKNEVICLIRHGKQNEIIVNGKSYNKPMPAFPALSDLEVAEISTYIYNSFGHKAGLIEVKQVNEVLNSCDNLHILQ